MTMQATAETNPKSHFDDNHQQLRIMRRTNRQRVGGANNDNNSPAHLILEESPRDSKSSTTTTITLHSPTRKGKLTLAPRTSPSGRNVNRIKETNGKSVDRIKRTKNNENITTPSSYPTHERGSRKGSNFNTTSNEWVMLYCQRNIDDEDDDISSISDVFVDSASKARHNETRGQDVSYRPLHEERSAVEQPANDGLNSTSDNKNNDNKKSQRVLIRGDENNDDEDDDDLIDLLPPWACRGVANQRSQGGGRTPFRTTPARGQDEAHNIIRKTLKKPSRVHT